MANVGTVAAAESAAAEEAKEAESNTPEARRAYVLRQYELFKSNVISLERWEAIRSQNAALVQELNV